jgi:hypothetical protein
MRMISSAIVVLAVLFATEASAQSINLTGAYKCVEACRAGLVGSPAFITQDGVRQESWQRIGGESPPWGKD